jgi:hypothetical protein
MSTVFKLSVLVTLLAFTLVTAEETRCTLLATCNLRCKQGYATNPETGCDICRCRRDSNYKDVFEIDNLKNFAIPALHDYIDSVLFSSHPDGAEFRETTLSKLSKLQRNRVRQNMHADVKLLQAHYDDNFTSDEKTYSFSGYLYSQPVQVTVSRTGDVIIQMKKL